MVFNYIFNYRYLVREEKIKHTIARFCLGFSPLVVYCVINVLVLIYI